MQLTELVRVSTRVAATSARSKKVEALASLLRPLHGRDAELAVSYLTGTLPQGRINVGYASVQAAARAAPAELASLTLSDVDAAFERITRLCGAGSQQERQHLLGTLLARATDEEQGFLRRLLLGELRQGALAGLMSDAIAHATHLPTSSVRRATMLAGDLGAVAKAALERGSEGLASFRLQLFRPLQPMLARSAENVDAALASLGEAALEYKHDGARIQLHKEGDLVRVYSRDGHEVSERVPEIVEVGLALAAQSVVLDGEALALRTHGTPQPFQVTMRRFGRKLEVERMRQALPLSPFFFDLLHRDGEDLIDAPFAARAELLAATVPQELRTPRLVTASAPRARQFYELALADGQEGLVAKSLSATYEAGRRGASWLKVKPAHTLDLVVLAAEWGSGRRRGWLSNVHVGAKDPREGGFVMLGKTFKGMTDAMLAWQTEWLLAHAIGRDTYTVYVEPKLVVEVSFDGVQASHRYPGGLALRFARVKRYRLDKSATDADSIERVREIFTHSNRGGS